MSVTLATLATEFLERPGLAKSTRRTYELVLLPLLQEYGWWSIETTFLLSSRTPKNQKAVANSTYV